jgi:hypothetical protein
LQHCEFYEIRNTLPGPMKHCAGESAWAPVRWGAPDLVVPDTSGGVMVLPNLTIP